MPIAWSSNSPGFIQYVSERGARRIELIPNGADPGMFTINESNREMRAQWGLADEFVVLYAGAHGMSNDLGLIADSAEQLLPHSNIRFVFVGDGKEKGNLQTERFSEKPDKHHLGPTSPQEPNGSGFVRG